MPATGVDACGYPCRGPVRDAFQFAQRGASFWGVFEFRKRELVAGAREIWFVMGIPIYVYTILSDLSEEGYRTALFMNATFMAAWIIPYGAV